MDTYRLVRQDGTTHTSGITRADVLALARELDYDAASVRRMLNRDEDSHASDDVGELRVKACGMRRAAL
jgi:hypothetical protein